MAKIMIASGPVIVEEGKVLLDIHGDTTFWKFCGGRAENLEQSLVEVASQRAKDEMGIKIEILDRTPFITHTIKETVGGPIDVILVHFLAKRIGEVKPGPEVREWDWLDINKLPDNLAPNIRPVLRHFGFLK